MGFCFGGKALFEFRRHALRARRVNLMSAVALAAEVLLSNGNETVTSP